MTTGWGPPPGGGGAVLHTKLHRAIYICRSRNGVHADQTQYTHHRHTGEMYLNLLCENQKFRAFRSRCFVTHLLREPRCPRSGAGKDNHVHNTRYPIQGALFEKIFEGYEIVKIPPHAALRVKELLLPANLCKKGKLGVSENSTTLRMAS